MGTSVRGRNRSCIRGAVKFEPPGVVATDRGLSVVLAELPNRAREIWPIVQTFSIYGPIVLLLLALEKTRTGKQAEAGPNRVVRR